MHDLALDRDRIHRTGVPEVVFAESKTLEQTIAALRGLQAANGFALATRVPREHGGALREAFPDVAFDRSGRTMCIGLSAQTGACVAVVCAGSSDIAIADEAAFVCERFGHSVVRASDVGVAGISRLFDALPTISQASVVIVVAGMEGALPGVVAGLVRAPVIAVPTSVGYGVAAGGYAALLGMLASCSPGIAVVNIDNGFGAAVFAHKVIAQAKTSQ